jgi:hypothetical protein
MIVARGLTSRSSAASTVAVCCGLASIGPAFAAVRARSPAAAVRAALAGVRLWGGTRQEPDRGAGAVVAVVAVV